MLDPLATPPSSNNTNKTVEEEDTTVVEQWTLRIKSFQDVYVQVPSNSVVSLLKDKARSALGKNNDKDDADADDNLYLRLICKGRLLTPDHALIQEFNVQDGDAVHAVLAQPAPPPSSTTTGTATATTTTIPTSNNGHRRRRRQRGTVVGPGGRVTRATIQGGENEDPDSSSSSGDDREEGRERMGFDRLRSNGLSRQEITAIRAYFSRHVERYVQQHANSNNNTDEPDLTRRRLMMGKSIYIISYLMQYTKRIHTKMISSHPPFSILFFSDMYC
jgi:hypothetical protein